MRMGELPCPLCLGMRLVQTASEEIRLAQPDHIGRGERPAAHDLALTYGLLEQRQRLGQAPSQRIRVPHPCRECGEPVAEVVGLAHGQASLEYRPSLPDVPVTQ